VTKQLQRGNLNHHCELKIIITVKVFLFCYIGYIWCKYIKAKSAAAVFIIMSYVGELCVHMSIEHNMRTVVYSYYTDGNNLQTLYTACEFIENNIFF